jgi:protein SCO1/2
MNSWAVRGWILFAALLAVLYAGWISLRHSQRSQFDADTVSSASGSQSSAISTAGVADDKVDDFQLTDQSDQPFGLAELKGKVWIASFFFASCPGSCRQLNLALAGVRDETPADVMLVSLTCDPDNDKPETLARYAEIFHADPGRWKFLTGSMADLRRVGRDIFKVAFEKGVHSERAFVVDRDGRIRANYSVLDRAQADNLIKFVRALDAETAPIAKAPASPEESDAAPAAATPADAAPPDGTPAAAAPPEVSPAETTPAAASPAAEPPASATARP